MARIAAAFGVPHTPAFPALALKEGPGGETSRLFAEIRREVEAARLDLLLMFDTDHLNTFFFDHLPVFAIGVADAFRGPNDETPMLPPRTVQSDRERAARLRTACIRAGFDVALVQEFEADHSVFVPLHFLTPALSIPVIPVFIGSHVPPWPSAARCNGLGHTIAEAVRLWPEEMRVGVIGSGSFSLDVFGTQTAPGQAFGVPDPAWAEKAAALIGEARIDDLIAAATPEQMAQAGNVGGEILNWIAMLACVGQLRPDVLASQPRFGHSYAAWRLEPS